MFCELGDGAQMLVVQLGVLGLQAFDDALQRLDGEFGAASTGMSSGAPPAVESLAIRYP